MDRMENYVIALGLRGYSKWSDKWVRTTYEMKRKDAAEQKELAVSAQALDVLNQLRERFVKKIETLTKVLKKRKKTVKEITIAVHEFLLQEKMQENVQEMENYFQEQGELALAKEYSQVYRIVMELFDKFVELLGDEEISLKEYNELLDAGLEEAKVGVIPPSLDQVVIGDMERTRLNHLKVLFFVGANDVFLPGEEVSLGDTCSIDVFAGSSFTFIGRVGGEKWKYNGWFGCCLCFCFFIRRVYCWSADNAGRTNKLYGIDLLCYGVGNYFLPHRRLLYFRTSTCVGWIYLADYSWAGITGYGYFQYNFSTSY